MRDEATSDEERDDSESAMDALLAEDEVADVLRETFYAPKRVPKPAPKPEPTHYKVICISMYLEDLERLDARVAELKKNGHRKMSRSALIRFALDQVDTAKLPRSL